MDLLTQLNRAMDYIEENIDNDLVLSAVATVTSYSPYHFGRIFYYTTDMSLSEYVRKRKLTLAAIQLQRGHAKIIDLALQYGYDSADSFTRAFVKQHGITPTAARQPGVNLTLFPPLTFQIKIEGAQRMNWRIEEREAFDIFGIEHIFANDETHKVPEFWAECHKNGMYETLIDAAGGKRYPDGHGYPREDGACVINAACGYSEPGEDGFPYMLYALKTPQSKTEGFKVARIPKVTWAVFRSEITDTIGLEIPVLFKRAYSEWLPSCGYCKAPGADMELYYVAGEGKFFEEVWIPVKKLGDT